MILSFLGKLRGAAPQLMLEKYFAEADANFIAKC